MSILSLQDCFIIPGLLAFFGFELPLIAQIWCVPTPTHSDSPHLHSASSATAVHFDSANAARVRAAGDCSLEEGSREGQSHIERQARMAHLKLTGLKKNG